MLRSITAIVAVAFPIFSAVLPTPDAVAARATVPASDPSDVNKGVVELETAGSAGITVRMAEDLASVINDGATRRIVPVVGTGALANLSDLKRLRGIDMAVLQVDVLDYAKEQGPFPGIEGSISYIAKLHNEEFHLLARPEIQSVADLTNKTVNVDLRDSGTAITASRLFGILKLPVVMTNERQEVALEKLKRGELAAMAFVAGKPAPLFHDLKADSGLHFLAVPFSSAAAAYVPTQLTAADYPGLVAQDKPVDTVAVGIALVAANLEQIPERYRNVANFVDAFFTGFQSLLEPGHHPKWQEVNITTELPGWRRYPPAEQWLRRNMEVARPPSPDDLKTMFAQYIDERRRATGGAPMTEREKEDLFQQYHRWESDQSR
ncbi:MAG: TRAP transporter substrate-binding protein [Alphaproteobacteria bacterium]|nr:TRAP transporter substrate-binding protein [Alphaproteobacteria bacterium]